MIYLKFLAVVPANVGACAHGAPHVREDVRDRYKVFFFYLVISLYGGCRVTDFSVNLPLSATQVHVKGPFILYNSWLYVEKKRFFLPLVFFISSSLLSFFVLPLSLLSSYALPSASVYFSARNSASFARVSSVSNALERCMYRNHI